MSAPLYHIFTAQIEDYRPRIDRWSPENRLEEEQVLKWNDTSRRESWIAGRILIKRSIHSLWKTAFSRIQSRPPAPNELEVISRNNDDKGIRPQVLLNGKPLPISLSLSHSDSKIIMAATTAAGWSVGIDLNPFNGFNPANLDWCWSPLERELIKNSANPEGQAALLWALKEAGYKAMNHFDEGFNPQQVLISQANDGNYQLNYYGTPLTDESFFFLEQNESEVIGTVLVRPSTESLRQIQSVVHKPTL